MPSQLLELIPVILFFISYKIYGIMTATVVLTLATICTTIFTYMKHRQISKMNIFTVAILLLFSSLTLVTGSSDFIKMKPAFVYLCFLVFLLVDILLLKKNFIGNLYEKFPNKLSDEIKEVLWKKFNREWCIFLTLAVIANEITWRYIGESTWVNLKVFVMPLLTAGMLFYHVSVLSKASKKLM